MLNKVISGIMNWFLLSILIPGMAFVWDVFKLRKENKELKTSIEELKNAKTKSDIDAAIDKLP